MRERILSIIENTNDSKLLEIIDSICSLNVQQKEITQSEIESKLNSFYVDVEKRIDDIKKTNTLNSDLLKEKLDHLASKRSLSKDKGEECEKTYITLLQEHLEGYEVTKTGNNECDIKIKTDSTELLIEIKDYSNTVPFPEVEKFHRDLLKHRLSGIMISDNSNISKKKHSQVEELDTGMYCIYLSKNSMDVNSIVLSIKYLEQLQNLHIKYQSTLENKIDPEEYKKCLDKLENLDQFQTLALKRSKNTLEVAEKNYKELLKLCKNNTEVKTPIADEAVLHCHFCLGYYSIKAGPSDHKKNCVNFPKDSEGKKLDAKATGRWYTRMDEPYEQCDQCDLSYNLKKSNTYLYKREHIKYFHE